MEIAAGYFCRVGVDKNIYVFQVIYNFHAHSCVNRVWRLQVAQDELPTPLWAYDLRIASHYNRAYSQRSLPPAKFQRNSCRMLLASFCTLQGPLWKLWLIYFGKRRGAKGDFSWKNGVAISIRADRRMIAIRQSHLLKPLPDIIHSVSLP